jgi:hypothetical protein
MDAKKPSLGCFLAHSPGAGSVFLPRNASSPNPQCVSVRDVPIARTAASKMYCNLQQLFTCHGEARRQCGRHSFGITTHGSRSIGLSACARNSRYREVLRQVPDGRLWIGTIGQGAYAYAHGALARITPHAGTAAAGNTMAYTVAVSSDMAMHWPASNVVPES